MTAPNANPVACTGIPTDCCPNNAVPESLAITISNNCGTYTGRLNYDQAGNGGSGAWTGSVTIQCKANPFAACGSKVLSLEFYCVPASGFQLAVKCATNVNTSLAVPACDPFSASYSFGLPADCNCGGSAPVNYTVSE